VLVAASYTLLGEIFLPRKDTAPSVVNLLAVNLLIDPLARKLVARNACERTARLHARNFITAADGLPSGRRPEFLCGHDRHSDYYAFSARDLREKMTAFLRDCFLSKGKQYYLHHCEGNLLSYP